MVKKMDMENYILKMGAIIKELFFQMRYMDRVFIVGKK